jgi:hypothetical protein
MADDEIRACIRSTFRSAEMIWGVSSPFLKNSTWVGYAATEEESEHLADITGKVVVPVKPGNPKHEIVAQLIRDLLPPAGRAMFDEGYSAETIYLDPPPNPWTPTVLAITLDTDPKKGNQKFTLFSLTCGSKP